jgi:hypothetical protein
VAWLTFGIRLVSIPPDFTDLHRRFPSLNPI